MNQNASLAPADRAHQVIDKHAERVETGLGHVVDTTARGAHKAVDATAAAAEQAQSHYVAAKKQTREVVKDRPFQTLAVAAGLGAIIGWLLHPRSRS